MGIEKLYYPEAEGNIERRHNLDYRRQRCYGIQEMVMPIRATVYLRKWSLGAGGIKAQ